MRLVVSPPFGQRLWFTRSLWPANTQFVHGSVTMHPRPGLVTQVLKTLRYDREAAGWVNAIGLRNAGLQHTLERGVKTSWDASVSLSIASADGVSGWEQLAGLHPGLWAALPPHVELNISCPNAASAFEADAGRLVRALHTLRESMPHATTVGIKVPPLRPDKAGDMVRRLADAGFVRFHTCNTLSHPRGGLSGPSLMPHSLAVIRHIRGTEHCSRHVHIVGGGGIRTMDDVQAYADAGADDVSISTLCMNPVALVLFLRAWSTRSLSLPP